MVKVCVEKDRYHQLRYCSRYQKSICVYTLHLSQKKFPYLTHGIVRSISHHVSKERAFFLIHLWKQAPLAVRHQSILK